jgi:methylase of polypeptide subunit release factors
LKGTVKVTDARRAVGILGRRSTPEGRFRRCLRRLIHFFAYHLILARQRTRITQAGGFRLVVHPTVFHPRYFLSSEYFAEFISHLDLRGKRVADVGTGSGILALAAACAGAESVIATDVCNGVVRFRPRTVQRLYYESGFPCAARHRAFDLYRVFSSIYSLY